MTRVSRSFAVVAVLLVVLAGAASRSAAQRWAKHKSDQAQAVVPQTNSMTVWQARRAVIPGLKASLSTTAWARNRAFSLTIHPESVRVNAGSIEWSADMSYWATQSKFASYAGSCVIDLRSVGTLEAVSAGRGQYEVLQDGNNLAFSCVDMGEYYEKAIGLLGTPSEAQALAGALNRLRAAARGEDREFQGDAFGEFQQKAAAWRALEVKPAISEEVRRHRLLAEHAVSEKQFDAAVEEYEAGLEIDPTWPEGHFNAALLCAELKYYSEAMDHMRAYLELAPDAPDAQAARDQTIIWEAELKKARVTERSAYPTAGGSR